MIVYVVMVIVILALIGLCFGSFTNALVWRIHEQAKPKGKRVAKDNDLSIARGRSMCPKCQHTLAWYDLLPVLSWLLLRAKCRYCKRPIAGQYPIVELLTATLFILSYLYWPHPLYGFGLGVFIFWLVFLVGFMALMVYDLRWMLLPDRIVFPLQVLAILFVVVELLAGGFSWHTVFNVAWSVLCLAGLFYGLFQLSKGQWIGGGDVKLAVVLGLVVGSPVTALLVIFLASLLGSFISIPLLAKGRLKARIPFGPMLILATITVYLFGASLVAWYKTHLLLV